MFERLLRKPRRTRDPHYPRVVYCLQQLQSRHELVEVRLEDRDEALQSMILQVDSRSGRFSLDAPHPGLPLKALRKRMHIEVLARYREREIRLACRFLGVTQGRKGLQYWCSIPASLEDSQRRQLYRLPLDDYRGSQVKLVVSGNDAGFLPLKVIDLSERGLRAVIRCTQDVPPFIGAKFSGSVTLPDDEAGPMHATMTLQSLENLPREGGVVAGISLSELHPHDRRRLQQFLARSQRRRLHVVRPRTVEHSLVANA